MAPGTTGYGGKRSYLEPVTCFSDGRPMTVYEVGITGRSFERRCLRDKRAPAHTGSDRWIRKHAELRKLSRFLRMFVRPFSESRKEWFNRTSLSNGHV